MTNAFAVTNAIIEASLPVNGSLMRVHFSTVIDAMVYFYVQ